jgi:hypothetical protein
MPRKPPKKPATTSNKPTNRAAAKPTQPRRAAAKSPPRKPAQPKLLAGGNPQIPLGYGQAPVEAYLAAMPGWKQAVGRRLDALITRALPGVHKAVKWNSPLYGREVGGWFLGIHCYAKYVKVAFFHGAALRPLPPGESKSQNVRYLNIHEDDPLDEPQFTRWVKQASQLPTQKM